MSHKSVSECGHEARLRPCQEGRADPAMQLAAPEAAGCRQTFTDEGVSGAVAKRPAFHALPQDLAAR